jgi:hypothetical protein
MTNVLSGILYPLLLQMQITPELTMRVGRAPGMMPASFKVEQEQLKPDYGELAIARVTPVDSCLWWLILLRAYYRACREYGNPLHPALFANDAPHPKLRRAIRLCLSLYLSHRFDNEPMLLVPDGAGMIDRRMGFNGYPLEIQALFYAGLQAARDFLRPEEPSQGRVCNRLRHLQQQLCDIIGSTSGDCACCTKPKVNSMASPTILTIRFLWSKLNCRSYSLTVTTSIPNRFPSSA